MNKTTPLELRKVLADPRWIFALLVLVVNDHFLKAAFANTLSGKLSDFAGLFLAPLLLAAIVNVKTKKGFWLSGLSVALVFSAINLSPPMAAIWDSCLSLISPHSTTVDPTDLIALVMIPLGIVLFTNVEKREEKKSLSYGLMALGILASIASTNPPEEEFVLTQSSIVSIYNQSNELHIVRIRPLEGRFSIDCKTISTSPEKYLDSSFFGEPVEWLVQSGQQIPIETNNRINGQSPEECDAALIESETLPDVIVFWTNELEVKSYPFDFDIPRAIPADPQTLIIHGDYPADTATFHAWRNRTECGSRADLCSREVLAEAAEIPFGASYFWESDSTIGTLHHARPSSLDRRRVEPTEACIAPTVEEGLFWNEEFPAQGEARLIGIEEGLDGCHSFFLKNVESDQDYRFLLCAPFESLSVLKPSAETPMVILSFTNIGLPQTEYLLIRAVYYTDAEAQDFSSVKSVYLTRGALPGEIEFPFTAKPRLDCVPNKGRCEVSVPLDLELDGELFKPGSTRVVGSVIEREVHLIRAEYYPLRQIGCNGENTDNIYLETVIITE